jgi:hypothetical protein
MNGAMPVGIRYALATPARNVGRYEPLTPPFGRASTYDSA